MGLFVMAPAGYYYSSQTCTPQPTPAPFQHFLVYSGQGAYDPLKGPFPEGCSPEDPLVPLGFCNDTERVFHKKIMGFSQEEMEAEEQEAKEFYSDRFGLDVERLLEQQRVSIVPFFLDPRQDYRAFVFSGECAPNEGYEVRDGGFILGVIDPEGVQLGGEFEGQKAPAGSGALFGLYNVLVTGPNAREEIIRYKAVSLGSSAGGFAVVDCDLQHPVWGEGLAQGLGSNRMLKDGRIKAVIRNVLTFPPLGEP